MNKRIICLTLAAVLTLCLFVPNIPSVQAANEEPVRYTTSQAAVELLKLYEGFRSIPYEDVYHWSIGYGTTCPDDKVEYYKANPMSKEEAEKKLRDYTTMFEKSVYKFADKYGLTLTQQQLDALVLFSYNVGSSWTSSKGIFHNAIANGATGNELIHAFTIWSRASDKVSYSSGKLKRRRNEANVYLNADYEKHVPANFCYTLFNLNGGKSDDYLVQGYDSNLTALPLPKVTYEGYVFEGWYTGKSGGEKVTVLDADTNAMTLYAHWRADDGSQPPEQKPQGVEVTVTKEGAQHFAGPGASYGIKDGTVPYGEKIIIEETAPVGDIMWGRYGDCWFDLSYTDYEAVMEELRNRVLYTGTIKVSSTLNIRSGPSTGYSIVGTLKNGAKVEIKEEKVSGSTVWGRIDQGWISLEYVKNIVWVEQPEPDVPDEPTVPSVPEVTEPEVTEPEVTEPEVTEPEVTEPEETEPEETEPEETEPEQPTEPENTGATGVVSTSGDRLRVRKEPTTESAIVAYLQNKEKVTVTEQKLVGTVTWGKVEKGWVNMAYIKLDPVADDDTDDKQDTTPDVQQPVTNTYKVTGSSLNIRKSASSSAAKVGSYKKGTIVTILETKKVSSTTWGRTDKGWVSMDYLEKVENSNAGTQQPGTQAPDVQQPVSNTYKVTGSSLNIRKSASSSAAKVGSYKKGAIVTVLETKKVSSTTWGRTDKGWVSMDYLEKVENSNAGTQQPDTQEPDVQQPVTNTYKVTGSSLNIRKSASSSAAKVGSYKKGTIVTILETKKVSSTTWGRTDKGWVSMDYLEKVETTGSNTQTPASKTYTVTASSLNIRKSASSSAAKVGTYKEGTKITVLETKKVGSTTWGRTDKGWISMEYVK